MLPPPMTMQTSTPRSWTDFTSPATHSTVGGWRPKPWSPISASPEIFSITRPYLAPPVVVPGVSFVSDMVYALSLPGAGNGAMWRGLQTSKRGPGR